MPDDGERAGEGVAAGVPTRLPFGSGLVFNLLTGSSGVLTLGFLETERRIGRSAAVASRIGLAPGKTLLTAVLAVHVKVARTESPAGHDGCVAAMAQPEAVDLSRSKNKLQAQCAKQP